MSYYQSIRSVALVENPIEFRWSIDFSEDRLITDVVVFSSLEQELHVFLWSIRMIKTQLSSPLLSSSSARLGHAVSLT